MESVHQGLSVDRIEGPREFDINDLTCKMCEKILWQPIACKNCEIPFCSACINQWLTDNSEKCHNSCQEFVERPCPRFIVNQLDRLQFKCVNTPQGCNQVVPYEKIEEHELECDYKPSLCRGCHETVLRMNCVDHDNTCEQIALTCSECNMTYKRGDVAIGHTEIICVKEQLRQLRLNFESNKQDTVQQIQELTEKTQQLPGTIQQLQQVSETNKQQTSKEIESFHQVIDAQKQQTAIDIQQMQQNFQNNKEKFDNIIEPLIKKLERK